MNDFTKEELFEMLGLASNAYGIKGRTMPIIIKLQSMIDNYCDHKERIGSSDDNGHMLVQCDKCDVVLWHEKD